LSFPTRIFDFPSGPPFSLAVSIVMRNTAWLRLLVAFMSVAPVTRCFLPACSTASISAKDLTTTAVRSLTYTSWSAFSFSSSLLVASLLSRSRISSL
jgi:hypothetical protein